MVLLSINIEGLHSNKVFLQTLINKHDPDFILLQETWLFSFQTKSIEEIFPQYKCICKCVDDDDPFVPYKAPRGYGGIAILYRKNLTGISIYQGNTERMITITQGELAITNVYLPCRGSYSNQEFYSEIDRLSEVCTQQCIRKHIIAGDFNVDVLKQDDGRIKYFQTLMKSYQLEDKKSDKKSTYFDKAGKFNSRIDYILFNDKWKDDEILYSKIVEIAENTSPHIALITECKYRPSQAQVKHNKEIKKPRWEKGDVEKYDALMKEMLNTDCPIESNEAAIEYLIETIQQVTSNSIPMIGKKKKKSPWSQEIKKLVVSCCRQTAPLVFFFYFFALLQT